MILFLFKPKSFVSTTWQSQGLNVNWTCTSATCLTPGLSGGNLDVVDKPKDVGFGEMDPRALGLARSEP